jgi:uncharacterized protein (TIGR02145 family)
MTKNLNYAAAASKCYDNYPANCDIYGRLYDWNTAQTVAPTGWHLPSFKEWNTLISELGGDLNNNLASTQELTRKLIATPPLWPFDNSNTNVKEATNSSGFSAVPGGGYWDINTPGFFNKGVQAMFWTSDGNLRNLSGTGIWISYGGVYDRNDKATWLQSIRLVRD